jgi:lipid A oxidase
MKKETVMTDSPRGITKNAAILSLAVLATPAAAEDEIGFYLGVQESPHSTVTGNDPGGEGTVDFTAGWEGRSFEAPVYYGVRWTRWRSATFGWGAEFTHSKVYADDDTLAATDFTRLELTDGINILTVNAMRRWPGQWGDVTPYVGGGVGVAIPHVDVESSGGKAFDYQFTGPAVRWTAGASYPLANSVSVFADYQGTYSMHTMDLGSGGTLETDLVTNAVNVGVSFSF